MMHHIYITKSLLCTYFALPDLCYTYNTHLRKVQVWIHTHTNTHRCSLKLPPLVSSGCVSNWARLVINMGGLLMLQLTSRFSPLRLCMCEIARNSQQKIKVTWSIIHNVSETAVRQRWTKYVRLPHCNFCLLTHYFSSTHTFFCTGLFSISSSQIVSDSFSELCMVDIC